MQTQFLIAAPSSGSGKTTVTLGLLKHLANRGYIVQPFKCGPDFIDTYHHSAAAKKQSINLDLFMMPELHVKDIYGSYSAVADISITEGVMGLFDGADRAQGSSASIAKLLNIPVILVVNAKAMAFSVAPLIYGFKHFDPDITIAGVIFNFVDSASHYRILKDACEAIHVEVFGYIPSNPAINIPSRHLGLKMDATHNYPQIIEHAAAHIAKTVDIKRILECCNAIAQVAPAAIRRPLNSKGRLRIAVAKDEAFNFTYHQNIKILKDFGDVIFFSPLRDKLLPEADMLYIAGGYPELYLEQLSSNISMRNAIYNYALSGGKILAECGGMMYLGKHIVDNKGNAHTAVGYLDIETSMFDTKLTLGYRNIAINNETYKGHEFHYSTLKELNTEKNIARTYSARNIEVETKVYLKQNVLASYIHFYWGNRRGKHSIIDFLLKL